MKPDALLINPELIVKARQDVADQGTGKSLEGFAQLEPALATYIYESTAGIAGKMGPSRERPPRSFRARTRTCWRSSSPASRPCAAAIMSCGRTPSSAPASLSWTHRFRPRPGAVAERTPGLNPKTDARRAQEDRPEPHFLSGGES